MRLRVGAWCSVAWELWARFVGLEARAVSCNGTGGLGCSVTACVAIACLSGMARDYYCVELLVVVAMIG